ncbi:hypothetical protein D7X32_42300, partial [Corallococcus carmarthensis]
MAAVPPRAAPTSALSEPGFQNPGVAVPRAAQAPAIPMEPRPGSAPTPAYGTEPHHPRPQAQAASGQPRGNAPGSPGLPRMDGSAAQASGRAAQAQAPGQPHMNGAAQPVASGQPRMGVAAQPASSGLPQMGVAAQPASSGLPQMGVAVQAAQGTGLPRREAAEASASEHWDASQAASGLPVMEDPAILPPLETPAFAATSSANAPGVSR